MKYLELADIVNGKYEDKEDVAGKYAYATLMDLTNFKHLLKINKVYASSFNKTDSAKEFYENFELFDKAFDKKLQEDVFYGAKLGYLLENVPCRLVYLLKLAAANNVTPSLAVQSVSPIAWGRFLKKGTLPEGIIIKDILDAVFGYDTQLITKTKLKIRYERYSEVYIENVDRICLLPNSIADQFDTIEDLRELKYVPKVGVCFGEVPLRTFDGRNGITFDEFDLRDAK